MFQLKGIQLGAMSFIAASMISGAQDSSQWSILNRPSQFLLTDRNFDQPIWVTAQASLVAGATDAGEIEAHAHDPREDQFVQGLDVGLNVQPTSNLSGFFNINSFTTGEGVLDSEWEEGFVKVTDIPGGFELRGGRFLNRIGTQNNVHQHAWDFIDSNLSLFNFLGEEGLAVHGGEVNWLKEHDRGFFHINAAYGEAVTHAEEEEEDEHGHEEPGFSDEVFSVRALYQYNVTDFHQNSIGLNYVTAAGGGETNRVYAADYSYTWRENGFDAGGDALELSTEYYLSDDGEDNNNGFLLSGIYRFENGFAIGSRYEWFQSEIETEEDVFATEERNRLTAMVSYTRPFLEDWIGLARVQYNQNLRDIGEDQSEAWLQIGFSYGGAEIR